MTKIYATRVLYIQRTMRIARRCSMLLRALPLGQTDRRTDRQTGGLDIYGHSQHHFNKPTFTASWGAHPAESLRLLMQCMVCKRNQLRALNKTNTRHRTSSHLISTQSAFTMAATILVTMGDFSVNMESQWALSVIYFTTVSQRMSAVI